MYEQLSTHCIVCMEDIGKKSNIKIPSTEAQYYK